MNRRTFLSALMAAPFAALLPARKTTAEDVISDYCTPVSMSYTVATRRFPVSDDLFDLSGYRFDIDGLEESFMRYGRYDGKTITRPT